MKVAGGSAISCHGLYASPPDFVVVIIRNLIWEPKRGRKDFCLEPAAQDKGRKNISPCNHNWH